MQLTHDQPDGLLLIDGYGDRGFRVAGKRFEGGIQIFEQGVHPVAAQSLADLTQADLSALLESDPKIEILLIGTGATMQLLPKTLRQDLEEAGIAADSMDTGAAARTYNVLLLEGRRVGAVLFSIE